MPTYALWLCVQGSMHCCNHTHKCMHIIRYMRGFVYTYTSCTCYKYLYDLGGFNAHRFRPLGDYISNNTVIIYTFLCNYINYLYFIKTGFLLLISSYFLCTTLTTYKNANVDKKKFVKKRYSFFEIHKSVERRTSKICIE